MRYVSGHDEHGRLIAIDDPLAARFAAISARAGRDASALAEGFLGLRDVFAEDLPNDPRH